jgi:hypothetical protein
MATLPKSQPIVLEFHEYDADARLLGGLLQRPIERNIDAPAFVSLTGRDDNHHFRRAEPFNADGVVSFKSGYTRASGNHSEDEGWVTLATAVVEGLNILDVITADRIVAQVSTEHAPLDGHVPSVTFLGTRFENLRVNGYPVEVELDLGICGHKPAGDSPYLEGSEFVDNVESQINAITHTISLSRELKERYDRASEHIRGLRSFHGPYREGYKAALSCSLVKSLAAVPVAKNYGNALEIPDFGSVALAKIEVEQEWSGEGTKVSTYFDLTMLDIRMGSIGAGQIQVGNVGANGKTKP